MRDHFRRVIKLLASLRLAVVIILALGILTAVGTFVEAEFNTSTAQKLVYHSVWMYGLLALLCLSLIAVMVDRWPWQAKHTGFILAHIGIIVLLIGSVLTRYWGIDGSMVFEIGQSNKFVTVVHPELTVFSSLDAQSYRRVHHENIDFFIKRPKGPEGHRVPVGGIDLRVVDYMPYAMREQKIIGTDTETDGPAIRFQLQNENVNVTDWLLSPAVGREVTKDFGPAKIVLTRQPYIVKDPNVIVLRPTPDNQRIQYEIYSRRGPASEPHAGARRPVKEGLAKPGDVIDTGWMGMVLRILNFHPYAREELLFHKRERPTELTTEAIKVHFNGTERWMAIDSILKFFSENSVFIVSYANRRIDLSRVLENPNFTMTLKKFEIGRYQGTMRAASYQSLVDVQGRGEVLISMNEPLKHAGFTFYQASFQEDETGRPTHSILSVNHDPGREIKYLGSLLIVLGTMHLFYFKKRAAARKAAAEQVGATA